MNDEASAVHGDPARAFDGQYQLGAEIGAGALGVVYRGVDERLDKPVAIKVWHARLEDQTPQREQYDAEARALTALEHPNLVAITDYGIAGKAPYLIMELLEGETLEARMRAGALQSSLTQTFMQSILRGLGYMHMRGVVHRNLKPDNVFLHKLDAGSEQLKLLDVGLESLPANTNAEAPKQSPRTAYDAPERASGSDPDGRSDVYAAGVMMLHMLSGREPTRELVRAASDSADLLKNLLPTATPEVRAFIARAIAHERPNRFGNADQMLRALLELGSPWADDPPGAVAAPAASKALSGRPRSVPAHAGKNQPGESVAHADTSELAVADGGEDDVALAISPIGLMAKLRTHKRLLLIGGVVALAATGGMVALALSHSAAPPHETEAAEHTKAAAAKEAELTAAAPGTKEQGAEEQEGDSIIQPAVPTAPSTPAEPTKFTARLSDNEEKAAAEPAEGEVPVPEASKPTGHEAAAPVAMQAEPKVPPSAAQEELHGKPASSPSTQVVGTPPSAANEELRAKPASAPSEHGEPSAADAVAAHASAATTAASTAAEPAAASGKAEGHAAAGPEAVVAKTPEPTAPTPVHIGSERHVEPDKTEIRQMLALAISPKARVASKNPWNIAIPDSLQALRDAIAKGERGSAGNIKALRRYSAENPDDVYGHLLLAGFYANRGFSLDALDQYDMAVRIDSSSRGAPEMLEHALKMVAQGIAEVDAVRFVERVYGREALGVISQRARARTTSPAAARRLRQLQARIGGSKRRR